MALGPRPRRPPVTAADPGAPRQRPERHDRDRPGRTEHDVLAFHVDPDGRGHGPSQGPQRGHGEPHAHAPGRRRASTSAWAAPRGAPVIAPVGRGRRGPCGSRRPPTRRGRPRPCRGGARGDPGGRPPISRREASHWPVPMTAPAMPPPTSAAGGSSTGPATAPPATPAIGKATKPTVHVNQRVELHHRSPVSRVMAPSPLGALPPLVDRRSGRAPHHPSAASPYNGAHRPSRRTTP